MEPNRMYTGLSQAAWGYFFITFDFNLNHVSILPRFVGYILLYLAVDKLSQARRDLNLLRPLAVVLICWFFGDWFFTAAGWNLEGRVPFLQFLSLVVSVCVLYFHFQFLTDMAALAEQYQPEGSDLNRRILNRRTALLILSTALELTSSLVQFIGTEQQAAVTLAGALCALLALLVIVILIMRALFELRRCVRDAGFY